MSSCATSKNSASASPQTPAQTNSYVGTQSPGDVWSATIDHVSVTFEYNDVSAGMPPVAGIFINELGFLEFSQTNIDPPFTSAGFAVEIPDRALLLRPGDNTTPLAALVPMNACPTFTTSMTFDWVALPNAEWAAGSNAAYGRLSATATGASWNFANLQQFDLAGSTINSGAKLSPGVCAQSPAGIVVSVPSNSLVPGPVTVAVGPSGFFIADWGMGNSGQVGVVEPSSAITAATIVNAKYLGFIYEPGASNVGLLETQLASFTGTSSSGTSMRGGAFPNDDPTQADNNDTTITLGSEDSAVHGLFKSALIIVNGTPLPAVAVVGNPENKFAIFLIAQDTVNNFPLAVYLFQQ